MITRTYFRLKKGTKYGSPRYVCSECGYGLGDDRWYYCPKCGAKIVEMKKNDPSR